MTHLIAAVTALAALGALFQNWREARRRATFEHLREVQKYVEPVWHFADRSAVEHATVSWYKGEHHELAPDCRVYLALLSALDLLAYAIRSGAVDDRLASEWLRSLFRDDAIVSAEFLTDLQQACGDTHVFEHLLWYYRKEFGKYLQ